MEAKKTTIWTKNFTLLFLNNAVLFFGQQMASTLFPKYLSALGLSSTVIGFIVSLFSYTALGLRPFTGPAITHWNKKRLFIGLEICLFTTFVGYAFSKSLVLIGAFRLLHGLAMGAFSALGLTMATDALPSEKIGSGLSIYGLSSVLATALGPGLGLAIMEKFGYPVTFGFSALLIVLAMLVATRMDPTPSSGKPFKITLNGMVCKESLFPSVQVFMMSLARACLTTFLVIVMVDIRQIDGMSIYYFINAGAMLVSRPIIGKMADKYGLHIALIPSYILFAATLAFTAICSNTWQLWLLGVLNGFGYGTMFTSQQAVCMKMAPADNRGAAGSTVYLFMDIGDLIGPTFCGVIADAMGYDAMFFFSIVPIVISALMFYPWAHKHRTELIPQPAAEAQSAEESAAQE